MVAGDGTSTSSRCQALIVSEPIEQVGDLPRPTHALFRPPYRFLLLCCRVQRIHHLQPQLGFLRMYIHSSIACPYTRHAVHLRGSESARDVGAAIES